MFRVAAQVSFFVFVFALDPISSYAQNEDLSALNRQVATLYDQRKFSRAAEIAIRALALAKRKYGLDHPRVGTPLNNLALLYENLGRYSEAEPLYKRSLTIREKAHGKDHPNVGTTLNNLASLYQTLGRYAEVEPLYRRSLMISEKAHGKAHPVVGNTLNNLAELYRAQGRYAEAERLYRRSVTISEKALGKAHPLVGKILNNLAGLYQTRGRYTEAEPLFDRSLTIIEKALGKNHPGVATTLNNFAGLHLMQGRYNEAERLFVRALAISEKAFGKEHPNVDAVLNNLAGLFQTTRDWKRATGYYRRAVNVIVRRTRRGTQIIGQSLTGKDEGEAARSSFVFKGLVKSAHRLAGRNDKMSSKILAEMFQMAQWADRSKAAGSLSQMSARQSIDDAQLAMVVRERQDLVGIWQRLDVVRSAAIAQSPSIRNEQDEAKNVASLAAIDNRIAQIDKRLAVEFPDYAALSNPEPLTIAMVQNQLRETEALVLFLDTAAANPTPEETFVWIATKTKSRWVRSTLGTNALKEHVDALRCGLDAEGAWKGSRIFDLLGVIHDQRSGEPLPFQLTRAHQLYKGLFGKVEDLIKGKDLLVVPSGSLTQLPFQVLVTEKPEKDSLSADAFTKASWLTKKHAISVLPSVASLASLRRHARKSKAEKPFIGFGNPLLRGPDKSYHELAERAREREHCGQGVGRQDASRIGLRSPSGKIATNDGQVDPANIRRQTPLPETADELCAVAIDAGAEVDDVYLGGKATETQVKKLSMSGSLAEYKVLHFATHGALAGELTGSNEPGLLMTPPNGKATRGDDGYLSASDVAGLKLDADWVILSACNTASGETANAEAMSGLAKAFFYAGARSILVSHWYVDSQATVSLITKAFAELKRNPKMGRAEALRQAMLALMKSGKNSWHPAYWAPFVVLGEGG